MNTLHENSSKNVSEMLPEDLPSDVDDNMKMVILQEGLELLHNGTGKRIQNNFNKNIGIR